MSYYTRCGMTFIFWGFEILTSLSDWLILYEINITQNVSRPFTKFFEFSKRKHVKKICNDLKVSALCTFTKLFEV